MDSNKKRDLLTRQTILKLAFVGYAILTIIVSLIPGDQAVSLWHFDKIGHYLSYSGLALLACLAFPSRNGKIGALLFAFGLGMILERIQAEVPGRDMSALDELANSLGILTGILLFYFQGEKLKEWLRI